MILYTVILTSEGSLGYSSSKSVLSIIFLMLVFVVILFAAYYTSRFVGNYSMKKNKNSNIKIIEATMLGPGKNLQLVKVGQEYLLIGVTKDRITFIKEINKDSIELNLMTKEEQGLPFSKHLEDLIKKNKKSS